MLSFDTMPTAATPEVGWEDEQTTNNRGITGEIYVWCWAKDVKVAKNCSYAVKPLRFTIIDSISCTEIRCCNNVVRLYVALE